MAQAPHGHSQLRDFVWFAGAFTGIVAILLVVSLVTGWWPASGESRSYTNAEIDELREAADYAPDGY